LEDTVRRASSFAALLLALTVAGSAAGSIPGPSFTDRRNDASSAPDISTVVVSSDTRAVTFVIHTVDAGSWTNAAAILDIDADASPATGNAGGTVGIELSYVLHSLHDAFTLDRSNGESIAHPAATASLTGDTLTITVPFAELGPSDRIGFFVKTPGPSGEDRAPNAGEWEISPNAAVTAIAPSFSPATPKHGHTFALTRLKTLFSDGNSGTATATCTAKLGTARLAAGCRWRLRANAKGKRLTIVVRSAGLTKMVRFTVR
jgi:hypothetical protein